MIIISTKDFGYNPETKIKSIPLYAVFLMKTLVDYKSCVRWLRSFYL